MVMATLKMQTDNRLHSYKFPNCTPSISLAPSLRDSALEVRQLWVNSEIYSNLGFTTKIAQVAKSSCGLSQISIGFPFNFKYNSIPRVAQYTVTMLSTEYQRLHCLLLSQQQIVVELHYQYNMEL